jgi:hypothetical protein
VGIGVRPSNDTIRPILAWCLILPAATEIKNHERGWNRFGCKRFFILPHATASAAATAMRSCYKTFMRPKWRRKLGDPMLMAEDGAPSLIFAME